jgi:hypothetical protein
MSASIDPALLRLAQNCGRVLNSIKVLIVSGDARGRLFELENVIHRLDSREITAVALAKDILGVLNSIKVLVVGGDSSRRLLKLEDVVDGLNSGEIAVIAFAEDVFGVLDRIKFVIVGSNSGRRLLELEDIVDRLNRGEVAVIALVVHVLDSVGRRESWERSGDNNCCKSSEDGESSLHFGDAEFAMSGEREKLRVW